MIGGTGLSDSGGVDPATAAAVGMAVGGPMGALLFGAGSAAANKLLGGGSQTTTSSTGFDTRQLPLFMKLLGQTQGASGQAQSQIRGLTGQRLAASQGRYGQLLGMAQGYGNEQYRRIAEREAAARGRGRMALAQRGLRNTTLGISSDVAAARQAARERSGVGEQVQRLMLGIGQQGVQSANQIQASGMQALLPLIAQNPQLLGSLVQNIGGATTTTEQTKKPGLFG